jgi:hypothetical protein
MTKLADGRGTAGVMLARDMVDKPRVRQRVVRQTPELMQKGILGPELRADD